jgi:hypothetical protein
MSRAEFNCTELHTSTVWAALFGQPSCDQDGDHMLKNYRLLPAMLLSLGVWIATPGCAARLTSGRGEYRQNVERRAFDEGHQKGLDRGRDDARRGRQRSYEQDKEYRDGDRGYRRGDSDRDTYRELFRQGFRAGYEEGFSRYQGDRGRRR